MIKVKVKKVNENAVIPKYESEDAAGFDLASVDNYIISAGATEIIKTGLKMEIPKGYEIQIRPRSGKSLKTKLRIANSPGTIDSDYRGEIGIILENIGKESISIEKGERIAQGILKRAPQAKFEEVNELDDTERGEGGFGSTGK